MCALWVGTVGLEFGPWFQSWRGPFQHSVTGRVTELLRALDKRPRDSRRSSPSSPWLPHTEDPGLCSADLPESPLGALLLVAWFMHLAGVTSLSPRSPLAACCQFLIN